MEHAREQDRSQETGEYRDSDVAVVGMACRFPGAESVAEFWQNLKDGRETTTFFTDGELLAAGVGPDELADPGYVRAAQLLPDVETFDAGHFKVPGDEAEILDPQHRHFLECAHQALEDAGYEPSGYDGQIGVFAGAGMNTYLLQNLAERYRTASSVGHYRLMLANDKDFLATRVSYKLDLRGPSVNINTACSTSLVAVHTACLSLFAGECDMALAGAVHLRVPQTRGYVHQEGMIFSPDGHCRAFDADAAGTVIGSGVGVVVLKRLADAVADGDTVHAVIKGSAVNNDGSAKTGYTAPSVTRQAAVIAEAQDVADCPPETIGYVEAHGTGTPLGDPIEVAALTEAFGDAGGPGSCALGSVKTNVGHLDTAAGMAGLIKTVLMLREGTLVPSLNFRAPNPDIDFAAGPFAVHTELSAWETGGRPRRAGVSSFGIGGTNAHVVLEQPVPPAPAARPRGAELLVLSARTGAALDRATGNLARYLRSAPDADLSAIAHTLAAGRAAHPHRRAAVCRDTGDGALTLAILDPEQVATHEAEEGRDTAALVLGGGVAGPATGPGAVELYRDLPEFRAAVDACATALELPAVTGPEALLTTGDGVADFVLQYALARVWESWGVTWGALIGSGPGQAVAGALAGVLTLPDALELARAHDAGESPTVPPARLAPAGLPLAVGGEARWLEPQEAADPAFWAKPPAAEADPRALEALLAEAGMLAVDAVPAGAPDTTALEALLHALGEVWTRGVAVDWQARYPAELARRVPLPTYPFERTRHWVEPPAAPAPSAGAPAPAAPAPAAPAGGATLRPRIEAADAAEQRRIIQDYVRTQVATVLGRRADDLPDLDRNLFDMDVDSLILIDITARLGTELGRPVPSSSFIEYPTIRAFTDHLVGSWHEGGEPGGDGAEGAAAPRRTSRRAAAGVRRRG
ncbi:type I polyketide synthase [Streptomyces noursei]|uniref:type I polyketide synthase n=1 Tax=Streptomyces noursei TaxID=1971 RepID=UPI0035DD30A2